jgi:hypothetical protein
MTNAKKEFLEKTGKVNSPIKCAVIHGDPYDSEPAPEKTLKVGYSPDEYEKFLSEINYEYDSGFGGQELFGYVWFEDGTWLERGEYDGSEWWEHKTCPEIPQELKEKE